jgi:hypothetical protein
MDDQIAPGRRPSGAVVFWTGFLLIGAGILLLLAIPMAAMFSEGIPESMRSNPAPYFLSIAALGVGAIVIGVGVLRGREWARLLAMGLFVLGGIGSGTVVSMAIGAGLALLLATRWRPA